MSWSYDDELKYRGDYAKREEKSPSGISYCNSHCHGKKEITDHDWKCCVGVSRTCYFSYHCADNCYHEIKKCYLRGGNMQTVHEYEHTGGLSVDTGSNFFQTATWREIAAREREQAVRSRQELVTYTCHRCQNQFCEPSYFSALGKPSCAKCHEKTLMDYSDLPSAPQSPRDHKLDKPDVRANYERAYWQFVNAPDHYQALVELDNMLKWVDASLEPASDGSWVKDPEVKTEAAEKSRELTLAWQIFDHLGSLVIAIFIVGALITGLWLIT